MRERPRVWITRAEPGAWETGARVQAMGLAPLTAPLLHVGPLERVDLDLDGVGAVAFTSANGVRAFARLTPHRDLPAYVVGEATAAAARGEGFHVQAAGCAGVEALATAIASDPARPAGAVLHPSAARPAGDLARSLSARGVRAQAVPVYETVASDSLPHAALGALMGGQIDGILLHSPRAAEALAALLASLSPDAVAGLARAVAVGLSPACLAPLPVQTFRSTKIAKTPREDALLDALATALSG